MSLTPRRLSISHTRLLFGLRTRKGVLCLIIRVVSRHSPTMSMLVCQPIPIFSQSCLTGDTRSSALQCQHGIHDRFVPNAEYDENFAVFRRYSRSKRGIHTQIFTLDRQLTCPVSSTTLIPVGRRSTRVLTRSNGTTRSLSYVSSHHFIYDVALMKTHIS